MIFTFIVLSPQNTRDRFDVPPHTYREEVAYLSTPVAIWLGIMAVIGVVMIVMKIRGNSPKSKND